MPEDQDADEDTRVDARDVPTVAVQAGGERATTLTPDLALLNEEIARTRVFLAVSSSLAAILMISAPLLSGALCLRLGVLAACFVVVIVSLWFRWSLRDPQRQTLWGHPAPKSWFEEGSAFAGVPVREPTLAARPMVAR